MKKRDQCLKCSNREVIGPFTQEEASGIKIEIGGEFSDHKIVCDTYICLNCGYIENYINREELIRVKEYLRLKGELS